MNLKPLKLVSGNNIIITLDRVTDLQAISLRGRHLNHLPLINLEINSRVTCLSQMRMNDIIKLFCPRKTKTNNFKITSSENLTFYDIRVHSCM